MTADSAVGDEMRTARSTRGPVPMAGTGDGPRPDPTTLAPAIPTRGDRAPTRTDGGSR